MRKLIKYGIAGTMLGGAMFASATGLPGFASSGVLQSGASASAVCQSDKLDIAYTPNSTGIYLSRVTVSNIDTACNGKVMTVAVIDQSGAAIREDSATVTGASMTLSNFPNVYIYTNQAHSYLDHVIVTFSDNPPA